MKTLYKYLEKEKTKLKSNIPSGRQLIESKVDIIEWLRKIGQITSKNKQITVTFIVDKSGKIWIADRNSEHVLCAKGEDILSAGEITFSLINNKITVSDITNQSTGYCPEPDSWPEVANALKNVGLEHPDFFTSTFCFRFCYKCKSINIIKDEWFFCAVCNQPLSKSWNFSS